MSTGGFEQAEWSPCTRRYHPLIRSNRELILLLQQISSEPQPWKGRFSVSQFEAFASDLSFCPPYTQEEISKSSSTDAAAEGTDDMLTDSEVKKVKEKLLEILNGIKQI